MNAILEIAVLALVIGGAAIFVFRRAIRSLRGDRPACCSDPVDAGQPVGTSACTDAEALGPDGKIRQRPSYCAGCTGCGA